MKQNRIVIVAAQPQYRAAMAEYLRGQEGIARVREADNGTEALQILTEEKFDILITDMIMPRMDGYTLLEELGRRRLASHPAVIAISALSRDDLVAGPLRWALPFIWSSPLSFAICCAISAA